MLGYMNAIGSFSIRGGFTFDAVAVALIEK